MSTSWDTDEEEDDEKVFTQERLINSDEIYVDFTLPSQKIPLTSNMISSPSSSSSSSRVDATSESKATQESIIRKNLALSEKIDIFKKALGSAQQTVADQKLQIRRLNKERAQAEADIQKLEQDIAKLENDVEEEKKQKLEAEEFLAKLKDLLNSRKFGESSSSRGNIPMIMIEDEDDNSSLPIAAKLGEREEPVGGEPSRITDKPSHGFRKEDKLLGLFYCYCGSNYKTKDTLRCHISYIFNKENPRFHCEICKHPFAYQCYLTRHLKRTHKITKITQQRIRKRRSGRYHR